MRSEVMADCIIADLPVGVDAAKRLGIVVQASYQLDEEVEVLQQLCQLEIVNERVWRRLMLESLARVRAINEVSMACVDESRATSQELEARLRVLAM